MTADSRKIAEHRAANYPVSRLEHSLAAGEQVIQRVLEMRCRFGEFATNLCDVLLVALLDLVLEELLERSIA